MDRVEVGGPDQAGVQEAAIQMIGLVMARAVGDAEDRLRIFSSRYGPEGLQWLAAYLHHVIDRKIAVEEEFKSDVMDAFEKAAGTGAYIVASSQPIPSTNKPGDNPPHADAKHRYQEIIDADHFLCTQEHGGQDAPRPIVFAVGGGGLELVAVEEAGGETGRLAKVADGAADLAAAQRQVKRARGIDVAPAKPVGFGRS